VLHDLIGERYDPDSVDVLPSPRTALSFGGRADAPETAEPLDIVRTMTDPAVRDGYFG
jgi:hypothetical protein